MYKFVDEKYRPVEFIYMAVKSKESESDWYGDFCYYENDLIKYTYKSNLWSYKILPGSSQGSGIPGVAVKTTLDALKMLGWESDYEKYKCSKEYYDSIKQLDNLELYTDFVYLLVVNLKTYKK